MVENQNGIEKSIKQYFEKMITEDSALQDCYEESRLEACCDYIKSQARKMAVQGCACVEDVVVYKWARDFMLGDVEEQYKDKKVNANAEESKAPTIEAAKVETPESNIPMGEIPGQGKPIAETPAKEIEKPAEETPEDKNADSCATCRHVYKDSYCLQKKEIISDKSNICPDYSSRSQTGTTTQTVVEKKPKKEKKPAVKKEDKDEGQLFFQF